MSKGGAEGVYCGSLPKLGLGYALKCDDGNMLAAETMVSNLLIDIAKPDEKQREFLQERRQKTIKNWRKIKVATMRAFN
jgi:L-asparaginase II